MLKIYHYDEEKFHLIFRIEGEEGINIISKILSNIKDSFYIDWQYILEEINEKNCIINKKIEIKLHSAGLKKFLLISPLSKDVEILAVVPV
ncbi:hypothetical protein [Hydrogenivirga sp. 128-5-R1-1]|uniref:hypothetical protein n=1 Tax=Hydrogenivirga sp. 128-5-R1-1 TaxID=392423 RepID=UPI00015F0C96|nr:hypothetical protein [Hydrogenivirga sp. 128-5-R1-1]EDP73007.1 hypothetical protein HG1285_12222 [Hydrogenivirga sp. 128-5-R1-1]